jgi:hypothetical protein
MNEEPELLGQKEHNHSSDLNLRSVFGVAVTLIVRKNMPGVMDVLLRLKKGCTRKKKICKGKMIVY